MSTSLSLNNSDSVGVTTFMGGGRVRCYTFHFENQLAGSDYRINIELTEDELFRALLNSEGIISADNIGKISWSNRNPLVAEADPELEKLLDEEERIARRVVSSTGWNKQTNEGPIQDHDRMRIKAESLTNHDIGRQARVVTSDGVALESGRIADRFATFVIQRNNGSWFPIDPNSWVEFLD